MNMPVDFAVFESEAITKGYEPKDQRNDKTPAQIFALKTKNNVKVEIKYTKTVKCYVAGQGLNEKKLSALSEELVASAKTVTNKAKHIHINFDGDIMSGFWTLVDLIENIETLVQKVEQRKLAAKFCERKNELDSVYTFAANHVKNCIDNGQPQMLSRCGGLFDTIDSLITVGYSVAGKAQEDSGKNAYREHIVPCDTMMIKAVEMYKSGSSLEDIALMFKTNNKIVLISTEEAGLLDIQLGLRTTMPEGWNFGDDVFARLKKAGIELK
jgi:hypothetical protein